jgi:transglutaminase-like putative cysteine protease
MHDWGEIYFEPYGWVPMDVTYGLRKTTDEKLKWFYLSGMDSYRLIFNDGFSMEFDPEKHSVRSETIDSQRGEVEWSGGNLYFDKWNWNLEWEILD